jgi:hypothetical protein
VNPDPDARCDRDRRRRGPRLRRRHLPLPPGRVHGQGVVLERQHFRHLDQPDYRVSVPNQWLERTAAGSLFDAVYSVPDREILNVAVVDFADPSLADAAARDEHLAIASDMVADGIGANPVLVNRTTVKTDGKTLHVATYDLTDASGIVTRVREYLVAGSDRAVIVTAYGTPKAIDRHDDAVIDMAKTARFTSA